jgi:hypothetical protein
MAVLTLLVPFSNSVVKGSSAVHSSTNARLVIVPMQLLSDLSSLLSLDI